MSRDSFNASVRMSRVSVRFSLTPSSRVEQPWHPPRPVSQRRLVDSPVVPLSVSSAPTLPRQALVAPRRSAPRAKKARSFQVAVTGRLYRHFLRGPAPLPFAKSVSTRSPTAIWEVVVGNFAESQMLSRLCRSSSVRWAWLDPGKWMFWYRRAGRSRVRGHNCLVVPAPRSRAGRRVRDLGSSKNLAACIC